MKLPLTVDSQYTTTLSKDEIIRVIYSDETESSFLGMKVEKHTGGIVGNQFEIQRDADGVTAFIEAYPVITGWIDENPMRIRLKIIPYYFNTLFFLFCSASFILGGIFIPEMKGNTGIVHKTTITDTLVFVSIGLILGLWGYLNGIRPIKRTEKWAIKKLRLTKINKSV